MMRVLPPGGRVWTYMASLMEEVSVSIVNTIRRALIVNNVSLVITIPLESRLIHHGHVKVTVFFIIIIFTTIHLTKLEDV